MSSQGHVCLKEHERWLNMKKAWDNLHKEVSGGGGGGGDSNTFYSFLQILGQFSSHGVGVSSYITNIYNKQATKKKFSSPKGGCGRTHRTPTPPPPLDRHDYYQHYVEKAVNLLSLTSSFIVKKSSLCHELLS